MLDTALKAEQELQLSESVDTARSYALEVHRGQDYFGKPYQVHLDRVGTILASGSERIQITGYLKGVLDTAPVGSTQRVALEKDLEERFGASMLEGCQLLSEEPGETPEIRREATYAKLRNAPPHLHYALAVKIAERYANLAYLMGRPYLESPQMYSRDHGLFRHAVYRPGLAWRISAELDRLARRANYMSNWK